SRADVQGLVDRKLELDARLNGIEAEHDALALATADEFRLWGGIALLERSPALGAALPEAEEARRKIRLLRGGLPWQLEKDCRARRWTRRRARRHPAEALVEPPRGRRSVEHAMRTEPEVLAGFGRRVAALGPRIDALLARVDRAALRHRAHLETIAIAEL